MNYSLTWLADVLVEAGLKVAEVPGWQSRGRREMGHVKGVLCHHTAGAPRGNMPSLDILVNGRSDLAGPLVQLGLGRDGTFYVIAAGLCNHAGAGRWQEYCDNGNSCFIGIEAENTGCSNDPWPEVQMDAYQRGVAAILRHLGLPVDCCVAHKEYAAGRKSDPDFDMIAFRQAVASMLESPPHPDLIPAQEQPHLDASRPSRPTLRRGSQGDWVRRIQARVGVRCDGDFGPETEAAVRRFQRAHDIVPDGIVGPETWATLDTSLG